MRLCPGRAAVPPHIHISAADVDDAFPTGKILPRRRRSGDSSRLTGTEVGVVPTKATFDFDHRLAGLN